ncbi:hypothetical protein JCM15415_01910 [Methanobacterium movens]
MDLLIFLFIPVEGIIFNKNKEIFNFIIIVIYLTLYIIGNERWQYYGYHGSGRIIKNSIQ